MSYVLKLLEDMRENSADIGHISFEANDNRLSITVRNRFVWEKDPLEQTATITFDRIKCVSMDLVRHVAIGLAAEYAFQQKKDHLALLGTRSVGIAEAIEAEERAQRMARRRRKTKQKD